jgi:acetylserotonin N-methyltransferase
MLDLGSGPGSYGIAFAKCCPELEVVLMERDREAINLAAQEIFSEGLDRRIQIKCGDFMNDDIGKNYDLTLLSSIICLFGKKDVRRLLEKVYFSLVDDGKVIVHDNILDASKTKPAASALFAVSMLVATPQGRAYALSEVKELLQASGFKNIRHFPFHHSTVIVASR